MTISGAISTRGYLGGELFRTLDEVSSSGDPEFLGCHFFDKEASAFGSLALSICMCVYVYVYIGI